MCVHVRMCMCVCVCLSRCECACARVCHFHTDAPGAGHEASLPAPPAETLSEVSQQVVTNTAKSVRSAVWPFSEDEHFTVGK